MAYNNTLVKRTAFVHLAHPGNASVTGNTSATGVFIPAGAIVTGVKMFTGAITGGASLSNAIFGISVGSISIVSNNNVQSVKVIADTPVALTLAGQPAGVPMASDAASENRPGEVLVEYVSTGTAATGITCNVDMYIDYLYATDHDTN